MDTVGCPPRCPAAANCMPPVVLRIACWVIAIYTDTVKHVQGWNAAVREVVLQKSPGAVTTRPIRTVVQVAGLGMSGQEQARLASYHVQ